MESEGHLLSDAFEQLAALSSQAPAAVQWRIPADYPKNALNFPVPMGLTVEPVTMWEGDLLKQLHTDLVTSHISALLSPEKLPKEQWFDAAGFVRQTCVRAANVIEELIEERGLLRVGEG